MESNKGTDVNNVNITNLSYVIKRKTSFQQIPLSLLTR